MNSSNLKRMLEDIGLRKVKEVNGNMMFCCPFHGENNPSAGLLIDELYGSCFACMHGFNIYSLVMHMNECSFKSALDFVESYGGSRRIDDVAVSKVLRYGETPETKEMEILPRFKLALMKSGKVFPKYLLNRGFTKDTLRKFMIGFNEETNRITLPVMNINDDLLGFINRAIFEPKINGEVNPQYEIVYEDQPKYLIDYCIKKSHVLYPINHFIMPKDYSVIIVEGQLDAIMMHQNGFTNTLSIINSKINPPQIEMLRLMGVRNIINFLDPDEAGETGGEKMIKLCKRDFNIYNVKWPSNDLDPAKLTKEQVDEMIAGKFLYQLKKLRRM